MKNKIITLGLITIILTAFTSCKCDKSPQDAIKESATSIVEKGIAIAGTLDPKTGNFIYDTGDIFTLKLPNNFEIPEIGKNSTEAKLFNFLSDPNVIINEDKTQGWITLDRVYFETGKSVLTEESNNQIKNLSEILKAFPNVKIKIGGYTDNTGSDEINKTVSEERAKVVSDELVKLGITTDRVPAEGYGQEHPVCPSNDTPECKAQNRRVDIRISEK